MKTCLYSISCTESDGYEVVIETQEGRRSMLCRVAEHRGIRIVQPTPDLMSKLPFDPRLLAAAVLAFHDAKAGVRYDRADGEKAGQA